MKKTVLVILTLFIMATVVKANLLVTEIMYNPNNADDNDAEWIEIFNNGNNDVDLTQWQLNGKNLTGTMPAKSYLVIARELVDSDDADNDSFESLWGNNDGVWDYNDGFRAIENSFTLPNNYGLINISNIEYSDSVSYSKEWGANGNGKSLVKLNLSLENFKENWNESEPTPGKPNNNDLNEIMFSYEIKNVLPSIKLKITPDEMSEQGVQVIANATKIVEVWAEVKDSNGADDIRNITALIEDKAINMTVINKTDFTVLYKGVIEMTAFNEKKPYNVKVTAFDASGNTTSMTKFEYVSTVGIVIETNSLDFGQVLPNNVSVIKNITIKNKGTVSVGLNISTNEDIETMVNGEWKPVSSTRFEMLPDERLELMLRLNVTRVKPGNYFGKIKVIAKPV